MPGDIGDMAAKKREELIQEGELPPSGSSKGSSSSGSRPTRETSRTPVAAKKKQQPKKGQGTKVVKTKPPPRPPQTPHRTRDVLLLMLSKLQSDVYFVLFMLQNEPAFDPFQQKVDQRITRMTPMGKLERIARGEKKDKDAYPTLGDVQSDWDDDAKEKLKPKQPELNDKQKIIAMGAKRDQNAYPTMDDIPSDWDSKEEEEKGRVEIGPKKKV
ncbi:hypothetical protein Y032_0954g3194 [Ancylostoma ceylanicum]|uniref:Uncharacterized protein n=1 Tax=Ancylostoma ceylanicum TaxID=53326 RepID=A0A016W8K0_9BILA|nr:hypothetical protein Y032_0954g3194 [Ancylostoma ceylanicum]